MSDFVLVPRPSEPGITDYALASFLARYRGATLRAYQQDLLAFLRWCAARPAQQPRPADVNAGLSCRCPSNRYPQLAWSAASTKGLLNALRESGPDRGCWTWWGGSQSPQTCGAVARHQLQHVAVHTYDAQITLGAPQPRPDEAALDGVDEFLFTSCATTGAWPHEPSAVDYHATEGRSWRLWLSPTAHGPPA